MTTTWVPAGSGTADKAVATPTGTTPWSGYPPGGVVYVAGATGPQGPQGPAGATYTNPAAKYFRAIRAGGNQTGIAAATYTGIIFDSITSTHTEVNYTTTTGIATVTAAGNWMIQTSVLVDVVSGNRLAGNVYVNAGAGGLIFKLSDVIQGAAGQANIHGSVILSLAANDTVAIRLYNTSATQAYNGGTETWFQLVRLS